MEAFLQYETIRIVCRHCFINSENLKGPPLWPANGKDWKTENISSSPAYSSVLKLAPELLAECSPCPQKSKVLLLERRLIVCSCNYFVVFIIGTNQYLLQRVCTKLTSVFILCSYCLFSWMCVVDREAHKSN